MQQYEKNHNSDRPTEKLNRSLFVFCAFKLRIKQIHLLCRNWINVFKESKSRWKLISTLKTLKCQTLWTSSQCITGRRCPGHEVSQSFTSARVYVRPQRARTWQPRTARTNPVVAPSCFSRDGFDLLYDVHIFRGDETDLEWDIDANGWINGFYRQKCWKKSIM